MSTVLIDHGASLYFHHSWSDYEKSALSPFPYIKDHALLSRASSIEDADKVLRQRITPRTLEHIVDLVPDEWLEYEGTDMSVREVRDVYKKFLTERLKNSQIFVKQAEYARQALI